MEFYEVLDRIVDLLRQRRRVSYRALKLQFALDDDSLEAVKAELIEAQQHARDEQGAVLVWMGPEAPPPVVTAPPAPAPLAYTPPHLAEKILTAPRGLAGERKQVTALVVDIKSVLEGLAERAPAEVRALFDAVFDRLLTAVHRFEGTVTAVRSDGLMALFGAPLAHEDHAIRACYAALAMQDAIRSYSTEVRRTHGLEMQLRIGLNAGEVVVRSIDHDLQMDYDAIGTTTHLATRIGQLAVSGGIRLSADTLRLVEGLVQVTALGLIPIQGLPDRLEVFELVGAGPVRRRLQAAGLRGLTRFVGRQHEIEALRQALERAAAGDGQVGALVGDPGVGKSRLVYEFVHSHRTQGWLILESNAVSYGQATPYFPVIDLLQAYFRIEARDDGRRIREKVTGKLLTLDPALGPMLSAFLALLDVRLEDPQWQALDPSQRRQRTLEAIKSLLLRESQEQPVLLVCEDLHWIDTETQRLLDALVESLPGARLLLLVNYRPEYQPAWSHKAYYTQLRLEPLPPANVETLLRALLGEDASLASLTPLLTAQTAGNPFFLEESVRTLVEMDLLHGERGAYCLTQPLVSFQVPPTVQAMLAARLDRLPPEAKHLLQTAAVIGHEVPFPLLRAIAAQPEVALHRGLAHLQTAEFLDETCLFPEVEYTFKHALTHQVAYGSLLQERRRTLHAQIVEALEGLAGERVAEQVDRLAHHAVQGEVWDKALAYCRQAGEKVLEQSAYRQAVGYFEQALSALQHLPERRDRREQAIDLRLALRNALLPSGDLERILVCLREAEALAEALDDPRRLGRVSRFLSIHFYTRGVYDQACAAGQRALALATASGDVVQQALANQYLGLAYRAQGDYRRAIDCLGQTVASLDGAQRRERSGRVSLPAVQSRTFLAVCQAELGLFAEGRTLGDEGLRIAEAVAHPSSLTWAYYGIGLLCLRQGDLRRALPLLERAVDICQNADLPFFFPWLAAALGAAYTLGGRVADAVPLLTQALEQTMATEMVCLHALCSLPLGEAQLLAGRLEEAQALAARALALARTHQERGHEAYARRLLGEVAAQRHPPEAAPAAAHYHQALSLAEELAMRPLQAHCHRGLGTLYAQTGQPEQARAALSMAIGLYRAMEMHFWLPQAEAALAALV